MQTESSLFFGILAGGAIGLSLLWGLYSRSDSEKTQNQKRAIRVYLIRHGEVENPSQVFYGRLPNFHLSHNGTQMARKVGLWLSKREAPPTKLISSPLERAMETANGFLEGVKGLKKIEKEAGVIEVRSEFEGKTMEFMKSINWELYGANSESFAGVSKRAVETIQRHAKTAMAEGHDSIVIVSHGDVCFAMRMWAAGMERNESNRAEELKKGPYISYCGVTCLELDVMGNCLSHEIKDWDWSRDFFSQM